MTTREIEAHLKHLDIVNLLTSQPRQLWERMHRYVYPSIHGTDHSRLLYYYSILENYEEHNEKEQITISDHIKYLKKIKSAAPGMKYSQIEIQ